MDVSLIDPKYSTKKAYKSDSVGTEQLQSRCLVHSLHLQLQRHHACLNPADLAEKYPHPIPLNVTR